MTVRESKAVRSLVLNGLTARASVRATRLSHAHRLADGDFYHELDIYRKLVQGTARSSEDEGEHQSSDGEDDSEADAVKPTGAADAVTLDVTFTSPRSFKSKSRPAQYMGSFPVNGSEQVVRADFVTAQLHHMKETSKSVPVLVVISLTGVKICRREDSSVRMAHALRRISYATCEPAHALFGFVAREPRGPPTRQFCHSFTTDTPKQAEELNALVGNAFRMAFATQLQPYSALSNSWRKDSSEDGSELDNMGIRAPTGISGLPLHYPHNNSYNSRNMGKCELTLDSKPNDMGSPSGSEESNSPTELNCYRRLTDKPPLMKRLAMGISGALMMQAADDSTPLVNDNSTSPKNHPVSLNDGYINEAVSESEVKSSMKTSNIKDKLSTEDINVSPGIPVKRIHIDSVNINIDQPIIDKTMPSNFNHEFIRKHNNIKNSMHTICGLKSSRATSSSSGGSSCGGCGANNTVINHKAAALREETELRLAPWFQAGIPREIALEVLANQPVGAFMVRSSTSKAGCFALSLRVPKDFQPTGIAHYLILRTAKGYKIKGFTKEFTSLTSLVTHHSVMPELLPCPLSLSRYNPSYSKTDSNKDFEDIDNDPDYNTLADFRKMMADLNV